MSAVTALNAGMETWSEWSDSELNSEVWIKSKDDEFVEPREVPMPKSLRPSDWKRFRTLDNVVSPIVFEPSLLGAVEYPDLISNNKHLLHSEFMRCFVSTLINIQYCGRNGLEIEAGSATNFSWNFSNGCWHGWYHVYSMNKAGEGVAHKPMVNPYGKYIVRIFFMNCWRRVPIDDRIPVDEEGRPLLPRTSNSNELWPMILAKALLKVAAASWTKDREIVDCNLTSCLTGWIGLSLNVSHLSSRDQWDFLTKNSQHYDWKRDSLNVKIPEKETQLQKKQSLKSKNSAKKKLQIQIPEDPPPLPSTLLYLDLEVTRDVAAAEISGITGSSSLQIYVQLSRDVPLDPAQVKPPLADWKRHRWLHWAIRRGLIDASAYFLPIRQLLIVCPLLSRPQQSSDDDDTINAEEAHHDLSMSVFAESLAEEKTSNLQEPEMSLWADFNKLSLYLRSVQLFYRRKFFEHTFDVSNMGKRQKTIDPSPDEALYLFVESHGDTFFLMNLSVAAPETNYRSDNGKRRSSSLIVERCSLFDRESIDETSPRVAEITTRGSKSSVMQLQNGRHFLRVFISSEAFYHAVVLSDSPFKMGDRRKMHEVMITESEKIRAAVERMSHGMSKAFGSFGTASYSTDVKLYYKSYMPESLKIGNLNTGAKKSLKSIHRYFREELMRLLKIRLPVDEWNSIESALRIFFLDPSIGRREINMADRPSLVEEIRKIRDANSSNAEIVNRSATIIQSLFRMYIVKRYKKIHDPSDRQHDRVKDALLRVLELLKDEEFGATLLRRALKRDHFCVSKNSPYNFSRDFEHVIQVQELKGSLARVPPPRGHRWIPLLRIVINASRGETVFAYMCLFANNANCGLQVFANDTKREIIRRVVVNNEAATPAARYRYQNGGYTVLAYVGGSSKNDLGDANDQRQDIEWSLHLVTMKGEPMFNWIQNGRPITQHSEKPIQPPTVLQISGTYIPNVRNLIANVALEVGRRDCLVTLRLRVSCVKALTLLRLVDDDDEENEDGGAILSEVEGGATLVVPSIRLESHHRRSSNGRHRDARPELGDEKSADGNRRRYFIRVVLRQNSWPLTEAERKVIEEVKTTHSLSAETAKSRRRQRQKSKRSSRKSVREADDEAIASPYWILQIVGDDAVNDLNVSNEICSNEDGDEEIVPSGIEQNGTEDAKDRALRGRQLREEFIEKNSLDRAPADGSIIGDVGTRSEIGSFGSSLDRLVVGTSFERQRRPSGTAIHPKNLPKLDLTVYMDKEDEEENSWVKSEYDEETLRNQRAMNILDFEQSEANFMNEAAQLMKHERRKYRTMGQRFSDNYINRARAIAEAHEARQAYSRLP